MVPAHRRRLLVVCAFALVLLVATVERWRAARIGLPYLHQVDEATIVDRSLAMMATGDFDPHYYNYGTPIFSLGLAVDSLHYLTLAASDRSSVPAPPRRPAEVVTGPWFISHPSFYLWHRRAVGLIASLAVAVVFLVGRRLAGDFAGVVGAGVLAVSALHIQHAATVSPDVPASCLALLAVWLALRAVERGRPGTLAWCALVAGLTVSTKYNYAPFLLAPWVAGAILAWRARSLRALGIAGTLPVVAFVAGTPGALLDLPLFLEHVGWELSHYARGTATPNSLIEPGWPHLLRAGGDLVARLGWPALLLGLVGIGLSLRRRDGWWLLAPLAYLALMLSMSIYFERNMLIAHTLVAIGCGVALARLRRIAWGRAGWQPLVLPLAVGIWFAFAAVRCHQGVDFRARPESRSSAARWLASPENTPTDAPLLVAEELALHPIDLAPLGPRARVAPLLELACGASTDSILVLPGELDGFGEPAKEQARALAPALELAAADRAQVASFGAGPTRIRQLTVHPRVVVRGPRGAEPEILPGLCAPSLRLRPTSCSECREHGRWLIVPAGAEATTAWIEVEDAAQVLEIRLASRAGERTRPRARVAVAGEDGTISAETLLEPSERAHASTLRFESIGRVRVVVAAEGDEGSLRVGALALSAAEPGQSDPG